MRNPDAAVRAAAAAVAAAVAPKPREPLLTQAAQPVRVQEAPLPQLSGSAEAEECRIAACISSAREAVAAAAARKVAAAAAAKPPQVIPSLAMPSAPLAAIVVPAHSFAYQPQGGPAFKISTKKQTN
jgi:hypothetical protein